MALHVGIFRFTGGMNPFSSVEWVWDKAVEALQADFRVTVHASPDLDLSGSRSAAHLLEAVDLGVLLLPYQRLPRCRRKPPLMVMALGSLQKGGSWLAVNHRQFDSGDTVIVNSTACRAIADEILGTDSMSVEHIPLGVDVDGFQPIDCPPSIRIDLSLPEDAYVLVYAGRLSLQKNVVSLLRLLASVRDSGRNAYLLLVGDTDDFVIPEVGPDGIERFDELLERAIGASGMSPFIRRLPSQSHSNLADLFAAADLGVNLGTFPNENFGLTVVEMLASGLPVVVTDWGGHRDTSRPSRTARHVPTMLSELGPRFALSRAVAETCSILDALGRGEALACERSDGAIPFTITRFAKSVRDAARAMVTRSRHGTNYEIHLNDGWRSEVLKTVSEGDDLRWARIDLLQHPRLYRRVVRHLASFTHDQVEWGRDQRVSRAFDWWLRPDRSLVSADRRWEAALVPAQAQLLEVDRRVAMRMGPIGTSLPVSDLLRHNSPSTVVRSLERLARLGLVVPD